MSWTLYEEPWRSPVLYPPKVVIAGRRCFDGGIADPLPVIRAILERPKLIVAISSVAADELAAPAEGREANIIRLAPGTPLWCGG